MKKLLFLLGGVFMITACSQDVTENFTETNANANPSDLSAKYSTYSMSGSYQSPWNIDSLRNVRYELYSGAMNDDVFVRVTPYIGLAYYDGADDGTYNTPTGTFNISGGGYPNLYASGREYGDYVQANPIVLTQIPGANWYTHELWIQSPEDHCPLTNIPIGYNYNLNAIGFDVVNNSIVQPMQLGYPITPAPAAATTLEERLLREYGKVFYYKVEFGTDPYNFAPDVYYVLALENKDIAMNGSDWPSIGIFDVPFSSRLFYHNIPGGLSTKEISIKPDDFTRNNSTSHKISNTPFSTSVMGSGSGIREIKTYPYYDIWIPTTPPPYINWIPKPNREPRGVVIMVE